MTKEMEKAEQQRPQIELDELVVLRDQVASLSMRLAQAQQEATRHQAIANQLAQRLVNLKSDSEVRNSQPEIFV